MAPRKTERIVNLTIALLVAGRYLPKSRIRELVEGYHGLSDAAFERTFERDKDELRALGVPIEVGGCDPLFEDEAGYRILPSELSLPPAQRPPAGGGGGGGGAGGRGGGVGGRCGRAGVAARQHGRVHAERDDQAPGGGRGARSLGPGRARAVRA